MHSTYSYIQYASSLPKNTHSRCSPYPVRDNLHTHTHTHTENSMKWQYPSSVLGSRETPDGQERFNLNRTRHRHQSNHPRQNVYKWRSTRYYDIITFRRGAGWFGRASRRPSTLSDNFNRILMKNSIKHSPSQWHTTRRTCAAPCVVPCGYPQKRTCVCSAAAQRRCICP